MSRARKRSTSFQNQLLGVILPVAGVFVFAWFFVGPTYLRVSSNRWQEVSCRILEHRAEAATQTGRARERIRYEYVVGGATYQGSKVDFDSPRTMPAQELEPGVGATTTCWFDPQQPSRSVLNRSLSPSVAIPAVAGVIMVAVGLKLQKLF